MWAIIANESILEFDSLIGIDATSESSVIDEPIEKGSFASYNKVTSPLQVRIVLGFNGDDAAFDIRLTELREIKANLDLISVIAGQTFYENMTIETLRYSRQSDVVFYLVDITLTEVREVETQTTTTEYSQPKVKNSDSTATVDTGKTEASSKRSTAAKVQDAIEWRLTDVFGGGWGKTNASN